jgi:hypothetical protein
MDKVYTGTLQRYKEFRAACMTPMNLTELTPEVYSSIKQRILADFANKLYMLLEETWASVPYNISFYRDFELKYCKPMNMVAGEEFLIGKELSGKIDINIDETVTNVMNYFNLMIPFRFPELVANQISVNVKRMFGDGEFPLLIPIILRYKDKLYYGYDISR